MTSREEVRKRRSALEPKTRLGKAMRGMRKALGISQTEWAEMLGVTQSAISKCERGDLEPTIDMLLRLLNFLMEGAKS